MEPVITKKFAAIDDVSFLQEVNQYKTNVKVLGNSEIEGIQAEKGSDDAPPLLPIRFLF